MRVYLRDGTLLTTVIGNIAVQNHINTPVPSATPNIPRPIAAFTQDKASGDVPLTVHFTNQSTGTINSIVWNFGDGNSSSEVNPSHTFGAPGLYNVTLTVTGPGGSSNVSRQINVTSPTAPVAGFTQDRTSGVAPLTVQFTDQSSGSITSYLWNFSDGATSTERNPAHTFTTPGTYNVFLTVTGPGGSSSVTRQITVTSADPADRDADRHLHANLYAIADQHGDGDRDLYGYARRQRHADPVRNRDANSAERNVHRDHDCHPADGDVHRYYDANGDSADGDLHADRNPRAAGIVQRWRCPQRSAVGSVHRPVDRRHRRLPLGFRRRHNVQRAKSAPHLRNGGTYKVTLTVGIADGRTDSHSQQRHGRRAAHRDLQHADQRLDVQFTDQSTGDVASVTWDFGDGTTSNDVNPLHTYAGGGTYTVTLTIGSADGRSEQTSQQVTVSAPLVAGFSAQPNGLDVQFTDQSAGDVTSVTWDFGDGSTSNDVNPLHTYPGGGTYTVTLTVSSADGRTNSTSQQVTVTAPLVRGLQRAAQRLGRAVRRSVHPATSTSRTHVGLRRRHRRSNDSQLQLHTYASGGTYTVTLTIGSADGRSDSTSQQVTVSAPLHADFTRRSTAWTCSSPTSQSGDVTSVTWDFGDGTTSNDQQPTPHLRRRRHLRRHADH